MNVKFHKITSYTWNFQNFTCDTNQNSIDSTKRDLTRAVASGGQGGSCRPGPVEPDKSSLWMDLFSLDSVILIIVTCNCLPFSYSRSNFSDTYVMTSAENSVSEPPNLTIFQGGYPQTPYNAIMPTRYKKNLATALLTLIQLAAYRIGIESNPQYDYVCVFL